MSRPNESSLRLQEAVDLLLMVEVMCQSANGKKTDSQTPASRQAPRDASGPDMPWTGIQLVLRESRKRIEDVLKNAAQSDRAANNGQAAAGNRPLSSRIQRNPVGAETRNGAVERPSAEQRSPDRQPERSAGQIREIDPGFLIEREDFDADERIG